MSGDEDPAFEPPAFELQVLPLSPQQVGLLLCLEIDILRYYSITVIHVAQMKTWEIKFWDIAGPGMVSTRLGNQVLLMSQILLTV